jgi:hypothetical protein
MQRTGLGTYIIDYWQSGFPYDRNSGGYNPNLGDRYTPYDPKGSGIDYNPVPVSQTSVAPKPTALIPYQSTLPVNINPVEQQATQAKNASGVGLLVLIVVLALAFGK